MLYAKTLLFGAICLLPGGAVAGVGTGDSAAGGLDARGPTIVLPAIGLNTVVHAGQVLTFSWSVDDAHPDFEPGQARATVAIDGAARDSVMAPVAGPGAWDWYAPDLSSGDCTFTLAVADSFGNRAVATTGTFTVLSSLTGVTPDATDGPAALRAPWPNPFNPSTRIAFTLAAPGDTRLTLYDTRGRAVRRLADGPRAAGGHAVTWNGTDDAGRRVAAGAYLLRLSWRGAAGTVERTAKVVMVP